MYVCLFSDFLFWRRRFLTSSFASPIRIFSLVKIVKTYTVYTRIGLGTENQMPEFTICLDSEQKKKQTGKEEQEKKTTNV